MLINRCEILPPNRFEEINLLAEKFLFDNGLLHIPVEVSSITRKLTIIRREENLSNDIEGYIDLREKPFWIVVNRNKPSIRRRFTEAHELGHFILHDLGPILHRDSEETIFKTYDGESESHIQFELEASTFAAALLMPESEVKKDINNLDFFAPPYWETLGGKYRVAAATARQRILRLIPVTVFHGYAFADTGKIICAYPTIPLEKELPNMANCVWSLNRVGSSTERTYLPIFLLNLHRKSLVYCKDTNTRISSSYIDFSSWFGPEYDGIKGMVTLRECSDLLSFCAEVDLSQILQ